MESLNIEPLIDKSQVTPEFDIFGPEPPMHLRCKVLPGTPWDSKLFKESLGLVLPPDLRKLWSHVSGLRLFEDVTYGQWGLIIWTPDETIARHQQKVTEKQKDFLPRDLIIGEFLGDSELLAVRCDPEQQDFGTVLIALPLDRVRIGMSLGLP